MIERESGGKEKNGKGEGTKVFSVGWNNRVGIVSGGEDCRIQVNRGVRVENADADSSGTGPAELGPKNQ